MHKKDCNHCDGKNCSAAYEQLGSSKAPFIGFKVVLAFLVPIIIFVSATVTANHFLPSIAGARHDLKPLLTFLLAGAVTMGSLYLIKMINKRLVKNKQDLCE